jgi:outer membrane protein insertion porin family
VASASAPAASTSATARAPAVTSCSEVASPAGADAISFVGVRGHARVPAQALCALLSTQAGAVLDEEALRHDVHAIWSSGLVDDVQVSSTEEPRGLRVVFLIRERPILRSLSLEGARAVAPSTLRQWLAAEGEPFDRVALRGGTRKILDEYESNGYRKADVQVRVSPVEGNQVDVTVEVREGPQARIEAFTITGASKAAERDLRALIDTDQGRYNVVGAPYRPETLERDVLLMTSYYYDRGRVQADVHGVEVTPSADGTKLSLAITVSEGAVFRLGKLRCDGPFAGTPQDCKKLVGVRTGDVFNRSELVKAVERLRAFQAEKHAATTVTPLTEVDAKSHVVNLGFLVEK